MLHSGIYFVTLPYARPPFPARNNSERKPDGYPALHFFCIFSHFYCVCRLSCSIINLFLSISSAGAGQGTPFLMRFWQRKPFVFFNLLSSRCGDYSPHPSTEPDVRLSRIRLFVRLIVYTSLCTYDILLQNFSPPVFRH